LWFVVCGLSFRGLLYCLWFLVCGLSFRAFTIVAGLRFLVCGLSFRAFSIVAGLRFLVCGLSFRGLHYCLWFLVYGLKFLFRAFIAARFYIVSYL
jgi:hypothetical protein